MAQNETPVLDKPETGSTSGLKVWGTMAAEVGGAFWDMAKRAVDATVQAFTPEDEQFLRGNGINPSVGVAPTEADFSRMRTAKGLQFIEHGAETAEQEMMLSDPAAKAAGAAKAKAGTKSGNEKDIAQKNKAAPSGQLDQNDITSNIDYADQEPGYVNGITLQESMQIKSIAQIEGIRTGELVNRDPEDLELLATGKETFAALLAREGFTPPKGVTLCQSKETTAPSGTLENDQLTGGKVVQTAHQTRSEGWVEGIDGPE